MSRWVVKANSEKVMNQAATFSSQKPRALPAILWGGFACGALDITAAFVVYGYFGLKPVRLL